MSSDSDTSFVRFWDAEGGSLLDSVSSEYEDSFSLETFADAISTYQAAGKCFIIARVQTWDHKQPDRAFYSYYDAYHLNKTLFQTQIYLKKKLIHRLHVMNPLTNTDIIGNVLYFIVKRQEVSHTATSEHGLPPAVVGDVQSTSERLVRTPLRENHALHHTLTPLSPMVASGRKDSLIPTSAAVIPASPLRRWFSNQPSSPSASASGQDDSTRQQAVLLQVSNSNCGLQGWTLTSSLVATLPEESVQEQTQHDNARPSTAPYVKGIDMDDSSSHPLRAKSPASKNRLAQLKPVGLELSTVKSVTTTPETSVPITPLRQAQLNRGLNARSGGAPTSAPVVGLLHSRKGRLSIIQTQEPRSPSASGSVTRFNRVVDEKDRSLDAVPFSPTRRRLLSYVNTVREDNINTFGAWMHAVTSESTAEKLASTDEIPKIDESKKGNGIKATYFEAYLLATDNDYLEQSTTRSTFKTNALTPEDVALFEMPEFTGDESAASTDEVIHAVTAGAEGIPVTGRSSDPAQPVLNCCQPTEAQLSGLSPCAQSLHRNKCWILTLLLFAIIFIVVIVA